MGRVLPQECEHGGYLDWGDFGNEDAPYSGLCEKCVPLDEQERLNAEYRDMNAHWISEAATVRIGDVGLAMFLHPDGNYSLRSVRFVDDGQWFEDIARGTLKMSGDQRVRNPEQFDAE